jgi:RNA polymerase sigma-32 factor
MAKPAPKSKRQAKVRAVAASHPPAKPPKASKQKVREAVVVDSLPVVQEPRAVSPLPEPLSKHDTLAPREPLQRYMTEVGRHPLLSRQDEQDLTWRYYRDPEKNLDAAYRLVTANLRLVVKIAYQYRRAAFNILDLIQEGNIGLMQAVKKFDPTRGIKLSSYAAYWIRAYILRFIMDNFRLVKLGTTEAQRKLFFNLKKEQQKLARDGISPEPKLLAERLQVSEKDVVEMQGRMGNEELSLDTPIGDEKNQTQMDRLQTHVRDAEEELADAEVKEQFHDKLKEFAKDLKDKEKTIFEERLLAEQPLTLQEIGDKYGLTRERVRQLEAQLTARLRAYMAEQLPDFHELSVAKAEK